ncbi:kinase domain protein, putative (macronuclear) [Tetrahymena thermophila SB210]|uniref:Kinase domain protein, putative n=1 Tax=Tetrahymena thermophila (strain SB210) TaxID=312017 RepID=W7X0C9_TETTS|nr:kinase domain protein, putative [Tetrahymena thermophila SB210]EWS72570.1 kinase domain protein, putative [Tetrahymena thermophila SB210]|eukprot:XP_012654853.1 kinase domain protein, putative [Tetrahymena thermophila SB210]
MGVEIEQSALPKPTNFYLNYNKQMLNDQDLENILQKRFEFDFAQSVQILLQKNNISEEGSIIISKFLSSFKKVNSITLNLEDNFSLGCSINCIFDQITYLSNTLTCLRLNFNYINFTDNGLENLSLALCQYGNLRYLSLGLMANKISDCSLEQFSRCLTHLKSITQLNLNLSKNQIEERGINRLLCSIAKIQNLKQLSLDLRQNNLKCQGVKSIAQILPQLENLLSLNLQINRNRASESTFLTLCKSFKKMKYLKHLKINLLLCQLNTDIQKKLKQQLMKPKRLTDLTIF